MFACDCILENGYTLLFFSGFSFTNMARRLPCQENFFLLNSVVVSVHVLAGASLFCVQSLFLIDMSLRNVNSLDFESSRLIDNPGARRLSILLSVKMRDTHRLLLAARPHLPPTLWSEVGNRPSFELTKLLLANGLISHPRCFFFSFPCLGSGWPHNTLLFINGLVSMLRLALFISFG